MDPLRIIGGSPQDPHGRGGVGRGEDKQKPFVFKPLTYDACVCFIFKGAPYTVFFGRRPGRLKAKVKSNYALGAAVNLCFDSPSLCIVQ